MATFEDYKILVNSVPENQQYFELVIISHSDMSKTYQLVNDSKPLSAIGLEFTPSVMKPIKPVNSNDLDQIASFTIADVLNELDAELDRIPLDTEEKVLCRYLVVLSDDTSNAVEDITFFVDTVSQELGAFTIRSSVSNLNRDKTGEAFTLTRFPMLKAI